MSWGEIQLVLHWRDALTGLSSASQFLSPDHSIGGCRSRRGAGRWTALTEKARSSHPLWPGSAAVGFPPASAPSFLWVCQMAVYTHARYCGKSIFPPLLYSVPHEESCGCSERSGCRSLHRRVLPVAACRFFEVCVELLDISYSQLVKLYTSKSRDDVLIDRRS